MKKKNIKKKKREIILLIAVFFIIVFAGFLSKVDFSNLNVSASLASTGKTDRIHFINVGAGDAILIESQGKYCLIDAGLKTAHVYKYLNTVLGTKTLDYIVVTHSHGDHTGGMVDVISRFADSHTVMYIGEKRVPTSTNRTTVIKSAINKGVTVYKFTSVKKSANTWTNSIKQVTAISDAGVDTDQATTGVSYTLTMNNFTIQFMNTEDDRQTVAGRGPDYDDNINSIIELVTHTSGKKALLTGDMQDDDEHRFICYSDAKTAKECRSAADKNAIKNVDILKFGHHGSYTSSTPEFLDWVNPKDSIITHSYWPSIYDISFNYGSFVHLSRDKNKKIYHNAYQEVGGHNFDATNDTDDTKKVLLANFTSSGYTIINGKGATVSPLTIVADRNTLNQNWVKVQYYKQTGWLYFPDKTYDVAIGHMSSEKYNGVAGCYNFHYKSGIMLKGFTQKGGKFYYFGSDGTRKVGTQTINGKSYTFESTTTCSQAYGYLKMNNQWLNTKDNGDDNWYYLVNNTVTLGWKQIGDYWYYFAGKDAIKNDPYSHGRMVTGWQTIKNSENKQIKYYFNSKGQMETGWFKVDGYWYYANSSGAIQLGWQTIQGKKYYLNPSTWAMTTGFATIDKKLYYFNSSSGYLVENTQFKLDNDIFFAGVDGVIATGWYQTGNKLFFLRQTKSGSHLVGSAVAGTSMTYDGHVFTFDSNGVCSNFNGFIAQPSASSCKATTYNGSAQTITNAAGTGYTFSGNSQTNVGTYTVTATLKDGYIWNNLRATNVTFNCTLSQASVANATVTVADQIYTGSALKPTPTVVVNGRTLTLNTDYTVTYSNNTNIGSNATVTINGKGNYTGSFAKKFNIIAGDLEIIDTTNMSINDNKLYVRVRNSSYINKNTLFNNIKNNTYVKLYKNSTEITSITANVGTAYKLTINNKEYPIVVYGDVDGTGAINSNDLRLMYNKINNPESTALSGLYLEAADYDGTGTINSSDLRNVYIIINK